ncbi:hypothetical protein N180_20190 [Pedobacter antarcticus 4BY]|uniref:Uncharacterized protein n=1 Tax=Pedobacter antarcticus 4BY TaxID=1358423 RepID=A0A081PJQ6_9SPHI|nr:hypothetical protein N180_20190 [Pedobacter antarcticus 4BY]
MGHITIGRNYIKKSKIYFLVLCQMKKTLLIFLAVFYFGISQGATVYLHYCMGELVQMGMIESQSPSCDFCGMTSKQDKRKNLLRKRNKATKG